MIDKRFIQDGVELTELCGCGSKDQEEVDGQEFEVTTIKELLIMISRYKEVHLNYFRAETAEGISGDDLDMWIKECE